MSGMLFLLFVQSLVQFGAKEGDERSITGRKIILTSPLFDDFAPDSNEAFKPDVHLCIFMHVSCHKRDFCQQKLMNPDQ